MSVGWFPRNSLPGLRFQYLVARDTFLEPSVQTGRSSDAIIRFQISEEILQLFLKYFIQGSEFYRVRQGI